ncbi:MAG: ABC transporter substrate-binding protein [Alphaproteobacteria bacterium]|nr:ABC transporter substrate-binding protein [Alphaproteobacteria bacterium]
MNKIFRFASVMTAAALAIGCSVSAAVAEMITVTDLAGRVVEVPLDPTRVILGEGRQLYAISVIDREDPFKRIIGWRNDMMNADPDAYEKYTAKFPKGLDLPFFGTASSGEFSVEQAIKLEAELVIFPLGQYESTKELNLLEQLGKAGVATMFIDFRLRPTQNTIPSLALLGKVFNERDNADEFIDYYLKNMKQVFNVVDSVPLADRPLVFVDRAAGITAGECCKTFGSANFGRFVEEAGGVNWGSTRIAGFAGDVNQEAIFTTDPDVIVGTGANWGVLRKGTTAVLLGHNAIKAENDKQIAGLAARPGWPKLQAVQNKRFYSVYHQFYNSPFHFIAIQQLAKWFYPEQFKDVDPSANFKELHDKFMPIDYSGEFFAELK